jgi:hypothetical protein
MTEDRARTDASAVVFFHALAEHAFHQVEILAHLALRFRRFGRWSLPSNERRTKGVQGDCGGRPRKSGDSRFRGNEWNRRAAYSTSITTSPSPSTVNSARCPDDHPGFEAAAALGDMIGEPGQRRRGPRPRKRARLPVGDQGALICIKLLRTQVSINRLAHGAFPVPHQGGSCWPDRSRTSGRGSFQRCGSACLLSGRRNVARTCLDM